jgi:hypothetical protein
MESGERILVQIAARSYSRPGRLLRFFLPMIGNFVVTDRRVFFLSSGKFDEFPFFPQSSIVNRIADSLDISALQQESSWEFKITELRSITARKETIWCGAHLRLVRIGRNGKEMRRRVYRYGVKGERWLEIATMIKEVRQEVIDYENWHDKNSRLS